MLFEEHIEFVCYIRMNVSEIEKLFLFSNFILETA